MDDNTVFEQSVNRRELLKKVAVYTPPLILGGRALIGAGVASAAVESESESSTGTVSEQSTSSAGSLGSSASSSPGESPLAALQDDLAQLLAIPATGQRNQDKNTAEAVGDLTEATIESQWSDGYTLVPAAGDNVFNFLKWGADALNTVDAPSSTISSIVSDIVTQAGTIANTAVTAAGLTSTVKPPKGASKGDQALAQLAKKAQAKLATGAQRAAAGNVRGAIAAYMHAWDIAVTGVQASDPDDSSS